jgi:O-antigen/teichoic acid export membrane protein
MSKGKTISSNIQKGVKWSIIDVYGVQGISFSSSLILARLLTPADFGLIGISLGTLAVMKSFITFGYSEALIQDQESKASTLNSIFILNLVMGVLLSALLFICAPVISEYYEIAELESIIKLLSIANFIESTTKVQSALFTKELEFKALAIRKLAAQLVASLVAIVLALNDFGVYALVAQFLIGVVISSILIWFQSNWRPKAHFHLGELQRLRPLAQYSLITGVLNRTSKEVFTFTIAKSFSIAQLGFYSRANSSVDFLVSGVSASVNKFLFPMLSRLQIDDEKFKERFMHVYYASLILAFILISLSFVSAESIINILFGSQWLESILIFKCLVIRGVTSTHYSLVKSAILAKRKIREGYIYDNLKRLVELSSLIGLILGGFNLFLLWLVCAQVVILIIQCVMIHRAMGYAYYELLNFMMVNLVVFSCGSIYIDFAIDGFESIIIQDCIRGLSVFTMIVLKFMIFDRKLLNEVRKTAMNILRIGR